VAATCGRLMLNGRLDVFSFPSRHNTVTQRRYTTSLTVVLNEHVYTGNFSVATWQPSASSATWVQLIPKILFLKLRPSESGAVGLENHTATEHPSAVLG
jgi:hypothetical protein